MSDCFGDLRIVSFCMDTVMGRTASGHVFAARLAPRAGDGNLRTAQFPEGGHITALEIAAGGEGAADRRTVWYFGAGQSQGYDPDCDPAALGLLAARIAKFIEGAFFLDTDA